MRYLMGIDGGGTKTLGVLTAMDGTVLSQAKTDATNPNDVTLPVSVGRLTGLCRALMGKAGMTESALPEISLFLGIAGVSITDPPWRTPCVKPSPRWES